MNERDDPYSPGAGVPPPELAGREQVLLEAEIAIDRAKGAKTVSHHILTGLRGVGKTVLLVEFERLSDQLDCYNTGVIEADAKKSLASLLLPKLFRLMIRIDKIKKAKHSAQKALTLIRNVASAFNVKIGNIELGVLKRGI